MCDTIRIPEDIDSIKYKEFITGNKQVNTIITEACKKVLRYAATRRDSYPNGEVAVAINIQDHSARYVYGKLE